MTSKGSSKGFKQVTHEAPIKRRILVSIDPIAMKNKAYYDCPVTDSVITSGVMNSFELQNFWEIH